MHKYIVQPYSRVLFWNKERITKSPDAGDLTRFLREESTKGSSRQAIFLFSTQSGKENECDHTASAVCCRFFHALSSARIAGGFCPVIQKSRHVVFLAKLVYLGLIGLFFFIPPLLSQCLEFRFRQLKQCLGARFKVFGSIF